MNVEAVFLKKADAMSEFWERIIVVFGIMVWVIIYLITRSSLGG